MKIRQNSPQNLGKSQYFIIFRQYFLQLFDFFRVKPRLETKSLWSGLNAVPCGSRFPKKSFDGMHPTVRTDAPMKASKIGVAKVRDKPRLETKSLWSGLGTVLCESRFLNIS